MVGNLRSREPTVPLRPLPFFFTYSLGKYVIYISPIIKIKNKEIKNKEVKEKREGSLHFTY